MRGLLESFALRCHLFSLHESANPGAAALFPTSGDGFERAPEELQPRSPEPALSELWCCPQPFAALLERSFPSGCGGGMREPRQEGARCHCSRLDLSEAVTLPLVIT